MTKEQSEEEKLREDVIVAWLALNRGSNYQSRKYLDSYKEANERLIAFLEAKAERAFKAGREKTQTGIGFDGYPAWSKKWASCKQWNESQRDKL